jgi:hypothetical protein
MSTKDCLQYFEPYGPTLVEWINDSSCASAGGCLSERGGGTQQLEWSWRQRPCVMGQPLRPAAPLLPPCRCHLSAGCVVFADAASARRAIAGTGHPLAPEELSTAPDADDQHMTDAGLDPEGVSLVACCGVLRAWAGRQLTLLHVATITQHAPACLLYQPRRRRCRLCSPHSLPLAQGA